MIEINNLNELIEAIGKYSVPQHVMIDVDNRIKDWLISGGNESDNYILNQCKYVERIINKNQGGIQ
ncbi:DUF6877 family protein [Terrisporobacter mayombei]|uniref:DUF6877 domain-containing protein n=1 Tax=Terrisporobacter mayombei TaxID=1541 RepID=A0ABY9PYP2_9FIRM|nr:DUF6877 family protein [Terrisporobacter mayombei]WMT79885.1 hypothetical protein TEMA_01560 [Terrisporobacter mayombei]